MAVCRNEVVSTFSRSSPTACRFYLPGRPGGVGGVGPNRCVTGRSNRGIAFPGGGCFSADVLTLLPHRVVAGVGCGDAVQSFGFIQYFRTSLSEDDGTTRRRVVRRIPIYRRPSAGEEKAASAHLIPKRRTGVPPGPGTARPEGPASAGGLTFSSHGGLRSGSCDRRRAAPRRTAR